MNEICTESRVRCADRPDSVSLKLVHQKQSKMRVNLKRANKSASAQRSWVTQGLGPAEAKRRGGRPAANHRVLDRGTRDISVSLAGGGPLFCCVPPIKLTDQYPDAQDLDQCTCCQNTVRRHLVPFIRFHFFKKSNLLYSVAKKKPKKKPQKKLKKKKLKK